MKPYVTTAALLSFALFVGAVTASGAEMPADVLKLIDQMKADAEAKKDMPAQLDGVKMVTTEQALKMWKEKTAIFLDNRVKTQYETEKIERTEWYPADELLKDPSLASRIDKSKIYVAYCNGAHCWRSPAVALILKTLGYRNVLWYRDGLPDWKKKGCPTE